jgi:hypothetical protein
VHLQFFVRWDVDVVLSCRGGLVIIRPNIPIKVLIYNFGRNARLSLWLWILGRDHADTRLLDLFTLLGENVASEGHTASLGT